MAAKFGKLQITPLNKIQVFINILKTNTEDQMAQKNHKCGYIGEDQTTPYRVISEVAEIALDMSNFTKASKLHPHISVAMEPSREKEKLEGQETHGQKI